DRARAALARVPSEQRAATPLIFTAHSVPIAMANGSPYASDFRTSAAAVARRLDHGPWHLAYQSRSGSSSEPWLEPDVKDVLKDLGGRGERPVVVVPIGFACDPVEVLDDPRVQAGRHATPAGR